MLLVDTQKGAIVDDAVLKASVASKNDYSSWVEKQITIADVVENKPRGERAQSCPSLEPALLAEDKRLPMFGWSQEEIQRLLPTMITEAKNRSGMGNELRWRSCRRRLRPGSFLTSSSSTLRK